MGGVRCSRLWSTSQLLRPSGQQCSHSGGVCPQIQGRQCGAYVGAVEEMSCVWMLQKGHSGDGCVLASTLCKYDLRKGDLFVLSWARVRRVRRGSISCCCCCLPSKTYGRNGVTPIFRSFHRTASSTTGGWSRWNILMCFFYISFWALRSLIFGPYRWHFFYKVSLFVYISIYFFASTLCMCVMYLTSI